MDERYQSSSRHVTGEADERALGWLRAVRRGFNEKHASDENLQRWWNTACADQQQWRRIDRTATHPGLGLDEMPVATLASLVHDVNIGGRLVPCTYITDVTVRATDRRQGLLRRMITDELTAARAAGVPLTSLTASEGSIYGRFGFGVAMRRQKVELDTRERFQLHPAAARLADGFTVDEADPLAVEGLVSGLHRDFLHTSHGAHESMAHHATHRSGRWDWEEMGPSKDRRCAVAVGPDGAAGAVAFRVDKDCVVVDDLVALSPGAELALWRHVASIDLTSRASFHNLQAGSPLRAGLVDARAVKVLEDGDQIWLRVLDVPALLTARGWFWDGQVVLHVTDPMELAAGSWQVTVRDGSATVGAAEPKADGVHLDVSTLGSVMLGGMDLTELSGAGLVTGPDRELGQLAALFRPASPPRNLVFF